MRFSGAIARKETPPDDDVCPVCFGDFVIPCRADCGHWFCGSCILQVWSFCRVLQPCKCPMCSRIIKSLKPHATMNQPNEEEARKVLKSIQKYNRLFVGGFLQTLYSAPFVLGRLFREMIDPNQVHRHFQSWRLLAVLLGYLYLISPFDFPESWNFNIFCSIVAIVVVLFIKIAGVFQRRRAAQRVRRLAASQNDE